MYYLSKYLSSIWAKKFNLSHIGMVVSDAGDSTGFHVELEADRKDSSAHQIDNCRLDLKML